jgi:hypothetical protein
MLKPLPVVVPYATKLAEMMDKNRVEMRRAFPHLMSMIQASALLHQYQRDVNGDGSLNAAPDDYQLAHHLLQSPLGRTVGRRLPDPVRRFYDRLADWAREGRQFTTTEAAKHDCGHGCERSVRSWLGLLADAGLVDQIEAAKGRKPAIWKLGSETPDAMQSNCGGLPAVEALFPSMSCRHAANA